MNFFHVEIVESWNKYSLVEQMANIGTEVGRTISWRNKNHSLSKNAFYRCLELIDLTISDQKNIHCLKEIVRVREFLVDYILGENIYHSTDEEWNKYFYYFNVAARSLK